MSASLVPVCVPPLFHRVLIISHVRKELRVCPNTEKASPRLCLLSLFVCLEKKKSTVVVQERILSIPAGGTTDLPLGSSVNDLLLFTN